MKGQKAISAVRIGARAIGMLALPSLALADPDSAFFSQQLQSNSNQQQFGPWLGSAVNLPQLTSTANSGASSVDLGAISAGEGAAMGGFGTGMQAVGSALSVPTNLVGTGGVVPLSQVGGGAGGGVSPGSLGASAAGGAFGAMGLGGQ